MDAGGGRGTAACRSRRRGRWNASALPEESPASPARRLAHWIASPPTKRARLPLRAVGRAMAMASSSERSGGWSPDTPAVVVVVVDHVDVLVRVLVLVSSRPPGRSLLLLRRSLGRRSPRRRGSLRRARRTPTSRMKSVVGVQRAPDPPADPAARSLGGGAPRPRSRLAARGDRTRREFRYQPPPRKFASGHGTGRFSSHSCRESMRTHATIARSRQIENTETPNVATPVNSPESVEYSSDDLDEDYVELNDDFIEKCNATTDARKIKKLLAEHAEKNSDDAEELLAKIGRNHDDWSTPEPTPTPIVKKRGMIKLNDEDMREAKKSLKEKGNNSKEKHAYEVTTRGGASTQDPLYPEGHPKRIEQDSQLIKTSAPSKKKKKKHKNVVESSEPVSDPNSISISDAETESGNEHEEDNDKNDTDKEEIEKEPEKHAKNKKYTKEDFITEKHGAVIDCNKGMVTFNVDDKEHTVYFPKRIDKDFKFNWSRSDPMVQYKIYNKAVNLPFGVFCAAIGVPQWGSCEKIRGTPRELSDLYTRICNGRSLSNDDGKISSIQHPAIRYFAYFITKDGWSITENELNAYIERESRRAREDVEETEEHPDSSSDAASSSYQHHGHVEPPRYSSAQGPYYHSMYDPPAWNPDPRWE
ncbi:hypothetical protein QYE76_019560 [Lolium multiflorum]|uniref:Uncharacterized protein n=1 Tax=Lolium multiflorum TaxID=4521 RepID=A0AAD8VRC8_LOLMU|nr:hypothetical protein QYE76_019560 [Lolium multiflorum]